MRFALTLALVAACGGGSFPPPKPLPAADDVVTRVSEKTAAVTSFQSESKMDYWLKKDRVRGTVLLLGKPGSQLRFNAENPTGGNVAVDLACDGVGYQLIDYNNNCQAVGPCTKDTIAALFKVEMEPDDFYAMAVGSTPVIPNPTGTVKWNKDNGHATATLQSDNKQWSQVIVFDGRDGRWDLLESTVYDRFGDVEWKLQNKSFYEVKGENGNVIRVPQKTKFVQPKTKADLAIIWKSHAFNMELPAAKFTMQIPPGLPQCP